MNDSALPVRRPNIVSVSRASFSVSMVFYLMIRVYLGALPGYTWDIEDCKTWALGSALGGFSHSYENTSFDYPPFYLYLIYPVGRLYLALYPELREARIQKTDWGELLFRTREGKMYRSKWEVRNYLPGRRLHARPLPGTPIFNILIKAPGLVFDMLVAALLFWLVTSGRTWGASRSGPEWGRLAAMAYLWNPVVLWCSGYWGTPDAIHTALSLASLALLGSSRLIGSGVMLSVAGLMKPLAAPLVPLLAASVAARRGVRGVALVGAAGLTTAFVIFLPFLLWGPGLGTLERVLNDIDIMPYTSVNAQNLWWIYGSWKDATEPILAGLSAKNFGIASFLVVYGALLIRNRRWLGGYDLEAHEYRFRILFLAAAVIGSFFILSTHMHENHLFLVVPLLIGVAGRNARVSWLTGAVTLICFVNVVLCDFEAPWAIPILSAESPVRMLQPGTPHQFFTWVQLIGGYLNSILACGTIGYLYLCAWRLPQWRAHWEGSAAPA